MDNRVNQTRIKAIYNGLGELKDKVVFVGGSTVGFYSDTPQIEARPTDDVDLVIEILNYADHVKIDAVLRSIGFINDSNSSNIARYLYKGITVDVLPTSGENLGINTKWYLEGFKNAVVFEIDKSHPIRIFTAPYFLATKFEAFKDRGKGDGRTSQDFEDIVYILEHRKFVWDEIANSTVEIREYLISEFKTLLSNGNLFEWIDGHVERYSPPASYSIVENIKIMVG